MSSMESEQEQMSLGEVKSWLADPTLRTTLTESLYIGSLLQGCIIDKNYKVSDALTLPIHLTRLGQQVVIQVRESKPRLKPNEVKFAVFLTFGTAAGLLVDPRTDVAALRKALSIDVLNRKILFPFIYGRDLHDLAAERFPEKTVLNNRESVSLLKDLPIGVFQEGRTTVGPFGVLESGNERQIRSTVSAPGYLCSDGTCNTIHNLGLTTAGLGEVGVAGIIRAREAVDQHIARKFDDREDLFLQAVAEARLDGLGAFTYRHPEALFDAIMDGLTLTELRSVTTEVLVEGYRTVGRKEVSHRLGQFISDPGEFVRELDRAQLLQTLLLFDDDHIMRCVDRAVKAQAVGLLGGEIRTRRLDRFGSNNVKAEIGQRGLRLVFSGQIVAGRLLDLLHRLYYESNVLEPKDLAYLLNVDFDQVSGQELLDQAVRKLSPQTVLQDLIVGDRRAAELAVQHLNVDVELLKNREALLDMLLWKLGHPGTVQIDQLGEVERHERELRQLFLVTPDPDQASLTGLISGLFRSVEDVLQRSLDFAVWSLTTDHYLSSSGFEYDPWPSGGNLNFLDEHAPVANEKLRLKPDGKNTIVPLAAGFARLAKTLQGFASENYAREPDQYPMVCRHSSRPFAFRHTVPFLDLSMKSQKDIVGVLQNVAAQMQDTLMLRVRNESTHGNNAFPSASEIGVALDGLQLWRQSLSNSGLFPTVFDFVKEEYDATGRQRRRYESRDSSQVLEYPEWAVTDRLPSHASQLVIFSSATLRSSGPLRFRLKGRPGEDPYWAGWPRRLKRASDYGTAAERTVLAASDDAVAG